jgi:predicted permease
MREDLRYAVHRLLASPGFTLVALAVLALIIGANTAIFSLLASLLTKGAPGITRPEQLVVLSRRPDGFGFDGFSFPDYCDYQNLNKAFSGLMAYAHTTFSLSEGDEPEELEGAVVSINYFSVLGVGTTFGPGSERTVVVSHRLWQRRFGGDPALVGKAIRLNGRSFTVAGIAPETFRGTELAEPLDVWAPIATDSDSARPEGFSNPRHRRDAFLVVVGRLKPGVRFEKAQAEIATIGRQLERAYPQAYSEQDKRAGVTLDRHVAVDPFTGAIARAYLQILMAAAGFVLLIACVNLANLLLARTAAQRKEIAVRVALGASRARLARQSLTESLALSLTGGVAGLLLAFWIARLLRLVVKELAFVEPRADARMLGFAVLVSIVTGIVFGLPPALRRSKPDLSCALKADAGTASPARSRLRDLLVISEVGLSLVLLIEAGLLVRGFRNLQSVDMGFVSDNVLLLSIDPERLGYDGARRLALYREVFERLNRMPGVAAASLAGKDVLSWGFFPSTYVPEGPALSRENSFQVHDDVVAPRYFETLKIPLISGRDFTARDARGAPGVVIVNEALARQRWPGENPIGKRLRQFGMGLGPSLEVVGVVRNTRHLGIEKGLEPFIYLPLLQHDAGHVRLHVRAAANPGSLAASVRREIRALDRDLPVFDVEGLDEYIHDGLAFSARRSLASLVSAFGTLALALAVVGLYGVMSYGVTQRTREIGVRMALGASRANILALVVGQSMRLILVGILAGASVALALTRLMDSILYGLAPADPATYAGVSLLLALVALAAAYIPAHRAAGVDPMAALRQQ